MTSNNTAIKVDNVIQFKVITNQKEKKLRKDGQEKRTKSNKPEGVSSEVYAFKEKHEIAAIVDALNTDIMNARDDNELFRAYRNKLLIIVGINIGIRASDLRNIKWSFFYNLDDNKGLHFKSFYTLQPQKQRKTKKFIKLFFNDAVKKAVAEYLERFPITEDNLDDYVFCSTNGKSITVQQMWNIINDIAKKAGIEQNVGTHSLRKTWGFWCWHTAQDKAKALVVLQQCFRHNDALTTMRYIGIMDEEISDMYNSISLGFENVLELD